MIILQASIMFLRNLAGFPSSFCLKYNFSSCEKNVYHHSSFMGTYMDYNSKQWVLDPRGLVLLVGDLDFH